MQYVTTADGVRIAFATAGRGSPLVRVPYAPFCHCQLEWRQGTFYDQLSRARRVITFDPRGTGLSDREVKDYSLDARVLDVEAVVNKLGLETFALNGIWSSGAVVIAYTARHPERVTHLILDDAIADVRAWAKAPHSRAFGQLSGDWDALTENIAFWFAGAGGEEAHRQAELLRACTTREAALQMWAAFDEVDVTELLPHIQAPTLILQHSGIRGFNPDHARQMATLIPNARLVMLEGKEVDDLNHFLSTIGEFLGDETPPKQPGASPFRTVLFTDIVGHTQMMQRLGDEKGRDVLREHERITREVLKAHGGTEVKTMGDGFLASFGSVTKAVECAIALQKGFAEWNAGGPEPLHVRVGLNAGEPIEEEGDLFGSTVILTSRITSAAKGGEILAADVVHGLCSGKPFAFSDRGEQALRGFESPVRVYQVSWRKDG